MSIPLMYKDFLYFRPAGALQNMVVDQAGNTLIGVYQYFSNDRIVLIGNCHGSVCVFWPEIGDLDSVMAGSMSFHELFSRVKRTDQGNRPLGLLQDMQVKMWISRYFGPGIKVRDTPVLLEGLDARWKNLMTTNDAYRPPTDCG